MKNQRSLLSNFNSPLTQFPLQRASLWTSVPQSLIIKAKVCLVNCLEIKFLHLRWKTRKENCSKKELSSIPSGRNQPWRASQPRSSPFLQLLEIKISTLMLPHLPSLLPVSLGRTIPWESWPESSSDLSKLQKISALIWMKQQQVLMSKREESTILQMCSKALVWLKRVRKTKLDGRELRN